MSEDGGIWDDVMVAEEILSLYRPSVYGKTVTTWFTQPYINQYWRIYIMAFEGWPSMKFDLIGYML